MMAVGIEGVLPIRRIAAYRIGEKLVLRPGRPIMILFGPRRARTNHFLQEDDIGVNRVDRFAQAVQDNPPVPPGKPLVNVMVTSRSFRMRMRSLW